MRLAFFWTTTFILSSKIRGSIASRLGVNAFLARACATFHPAEDIGSALKGGVNVCQREFVNEVLGPLVTKFIRNFGGEDATPIQHAFPTAAFSITGRLVKRIRHNALRHLMPTKRACPQNNIHSYAYVILTITC
jgi:hypothetical protein